MYAPTHCMWALRRPVCFYITCNCSRLVRGCGSFVVLWAATSCALVIGYSVLQTICFTCARSGLRSTRDSAPTLRPPSEFTIRLDGAPTCAGRVEGRCTQRQRRRFTRVPHRLIHTEFRYGSQIFFRVLVLLKPAGKRSKPVAWGSCCGCGCSVAEAQLHPETSRCGCQQQWPWIPLRPSPQILPGTLLPVSPDHVLLEHLLSDLGLGSVYLFFS